MSFTAVTPYGNRCPVCGSMNIVENEIGELVCANCGFVLSEGVYNIAPYVPLKEGRQGPRGESTTSNVLHDHGIRSEMEFAGAKLTPRMKKRMRELNKINKRLYFTNSEQSAEGDLRKTLENMLGLLKAPSFVRDEARLLAGKLMKQHYDKNKRILGMRKNYPYISLALITLAMDIHKQPYKLSDIIENLGMSQQEKNKVLEWRKRIKTWLNIKAVPVNEALEAYMVLLNEVLDELERRGVVDKSKKKDIRNVAANILKKFIMKEYTGGKKKESVVGAAIYLASIVTGNRIRQQDIARVVKEKDSALRRSYKEILSRIIIVVRVPAK